jgi:type VI secretion system FHA domain protein
MNLTLEVISANGSSMGGARRKVFGEAGGSIGRAADCDWVLPSPDKYVSRHHASVLFKYGQFYIKAEGENSVAVNDPNTQLTADAPSPLKQGDRVYIDEYEILVSLPREVARPPLIVGDPFADEPGEEALIPAGGTLGDENLDPLSQLIGGSTRSSPSEPRYRGPPAGDVLSDPFIPTPIQTPRVNPPLIPRDALMPSSRDESPIPSGGGTGTVIPTDPDAWNKTTYGLNSIQKPVEAPPPPRPPTRPVAAPPVSAAPREAMRQAPPPRPPSPPVPPLRPAASRPAAAPAPHPASPPPATPAPPRRAPPTAAQSPASAPRAAPAPVAAAVVAPRGAAFDVDAMLAAAGVDPQNVAPEMAATLGQILMVVVQGTIDALRARDEVKSQFRLAVTRVRSTDNNPLTFAVDAADAMNSLLSRRNAAFLPPLEAFQRAFDDIRGHQMALLAGMRAGFDSLMNRLDPEQLQEDFDKQAKHGGGLLSAVAKPKYWDQYKDYFAGLQGDREDAFRRLFGEEFALAYEKQVELIKRSRDNKNR